jgi:hypothetical protein
MEITKFQKLHFILNNVGVTYVYKETIWKIDMQLERTWA